MMGSEVSDMEIQENPCRLHGLSDCSLCYDGTYSLDLSKSVNRATVSNFLERTRKPNGKEEIHARANRRREFARRIRKARISDDVIVLSSEDEETIEVAAAALAPAPANPVLEEQTNDVRPSEPVPSAGILTVAHLLGEVAVDQIASAGQVPPLTVPESAQSLVEPVQSMTTVPVTSPFRTPDEVLEDLFLREIMNSYSTNTATCCCTTVQEQPLTRVQQRPNSAHLPTERVSQTNQSTAQAPAPNLNDPKATLLCMLEPRNGHMPAFTSNVKSHQADQGPSITSVPWLSKPTSAAHSSELTTSTGNPPTYNKPISLAEPRNGVVLSKSFMKTAQNPRRSMSSSLVARPKVSVGKALQSVGTVRTSVIKTNPLASTSIIRQHHFASKPIAQQLRAVGTEMDTPKPICYEMNTEGNWLPRVCEHNCCGKGVICETVKCVTKDCPGLGGRRSIGDALEQSKEEKKQASRQETGNFSLEKSMIRSQFSAGPSSPLSRSHHHSKQQQTSSPGFSHSANPVSKFSIYASNDQCPRSVKCRTRIVYGGGPYLGSQLMSNPGSDLRENKMVSSNDIRQRSTKKASNQAVLAGFHHLNSPLLTRTQCPKGVESPSKVLASESPSCVGPTASVQSSLGGKGTSSNTKDTRNSETCEQGSLPARQAESHQPNKSLPSTVNEGVSSGSSSVGMPSTSGSSRKSVQKLAAQESNPQPKPSLPSTSLTANDVESSHKPLVRPSSPDPEHDLLSNEKRQKLGADETRCEESPLPNIHQPNTTTLPRTSWSANDMMSPKKPLVRPGTAHALPSHTKPQKLPSRETKTIQSPLNNILHSNPSLLPWSANEDEGSSKSPNAGPSPLDAEHSLPNSVALSEVATQELNNVQAISSEIFQQTSSACAQNASSNCLCPLTDSGPSDSHTVQQQLPQQNLPLPPFESINSKSLTSGIKEYWSHSEPSEPFQDEESAGNESLNLEAVCASLESPAESPAPGKRSATAPDRIVPGRNNDNSSSLTRDSIRTAVPNLPTRKHRRKPSAPKKITLKPKHGAIQQRLAIPSLNRRSEDFIVVCDGEAFKIKSSTVEQASPVIKDFADKCCTWLDIDGEEYRAFEVLGVPSWAMSEILKFVCRTEYSHRVMGTTHMKRLLEKLKIKYRQSNSFIFLDN